MSDVKKTDLKMHKIIYKGSLGMHTVLGDSVVLGTQISYGYHAGGDVFEVAEEDILANSSRYTAWPCDKPYEIKDGKLVGPCGDIEPRDSVGTIEGLPGIGKKTAEKLAKMGIVTEDDVLNKVDDEVLKGLPPRSRTSIKKWQEQQKA